MTQLQGKLLSGEAMINKKYVFLPFIVFIVFLFLSCQTAEFGFKTADINGMVYDFSNRPVFNYEVVLGEEYFGSTDINGRFTLLKVSLGNHKISGSKTGFENYNGEVIIKEKGQIIYIRIPSQNQLLALADEVLAANNFTLAEEIAERAYQIDKNNIEMLFYYAAVSFRQNNFAKAASFLEDAVNLGSKDYYVQKFLFAIKEMQNEKQAN
jgi:tetratricopeptide (TPR) repeat protein